jgi:hypothetical protein
MNANIRLVAGILVGATVFYILDLTSKYLPGGIGPGIHLASIVLAPIITVMISKTSRNRSIMASSVAYLVYVVPTDISGYAIRGMQFFPNLSAYSFVTQVTAIVSGIIFGALVAGAVGLISYKLLATRRSEIRVA